MVKSADKTTSFIAVVIWYDPDPFMPENILSYANNVDHVIVLDNSVNNNADMLPCLKNIIYVPLGHNFGIATALNHGASKAAELGADWVLTMDQDSSFTFNEFERLKATVKALQHDENIAAIGPITDSLKDKDYELKEVGEIITSGSLNRLSHLQCVGGYNNDLFIDCVDFELSFRLRKAGYKIFMDSGVKLDHRRGTPAIVSWRGRDHTIYNYTSTRYYYQVRNNLYIGSRFPEYRRSSRKKILKNLRNVLLFEANKVSKLTAMAQGALHFILGRYGPR